MNDPGLRALLRLSLDEDIGRGDLTSEATVAPATRATAVLGARESCVVAGLALFDPLVDECAKRAGLDAARSLGMTGSVGDGAHVKSGAALCTIAGDARALLTFERTFLNFVGRLSGIATLTARFVDAVRAAGASTRVLDTRKTTPGHRLLEKYAVRCGGGANHRMGLYDAVLIKDNHIVAAGGVRAAVTRALAHAPAGIDVEVECDSVAQAEDALAAGATALLLDNFAPDKLAAAVKVIAGRARVEVSGGVNLDNVAAYARAGADDVSVGRLTHSAPSINVGLDFTLEKA